MTRRSQVFISKSNNIAGHGPFSSNANNVANQKNGWLRCFWVINTHTSLYEIDGNGEVVMKKDGRIILALTLVIAVVLTAVFAFFIS